MHSMATVKRYLAYENKHQNRTRSSLAFESGHGKSVAMNRILRSKQSCNFCAPAE